MPSFPSQPFGLLCFLNIKHVTMQFRDDILWRILFPIASNFNASADGDGISLIARDNK